LLVLSVKGTVSRRADGLDDGFDGVGLDDGFDGVGLGAGSHLATGLMMSKN